MKSGSSWGNGDGGISDRTEPRDGHLGDWNPRYQLRAPSNSPRPEFRPSRISPRPEFRVPNFAARERLSYRLVLPPLDLPVWLGLPPDLPFADLFCPFEAMTHLHMRHLLVTAPT